MKILIYSEKILNALSIMMRIGGITLYPFIILREKYQTAEYIKENSRIVNHESIHIKQQQEVMITTLLICLGLKLIGIGYWWLIPIISYAMFFILYVVEYFLRIIIGFILTGPVRANEAYRSISFEHEAYTNESNLDYLKTRRWLSFLKYML